MNIVKRLKIGEYYKTRFEKIMDSQDEMDSQSIRKIWMENHMY